MSKSWVFTGPWGPVPADVYRGEVGAQRLHRKEGGYVNVSWDGGIPIAEYFGRGIEVREAGPANSTPTKAKPTSAFDEQVGGGHYTDMKIQPFQFSMANGLDPMQHTIVKYVTRFRSKNGAEDLKKARHTLDLLIEWEQNNAKQ